MKTIPIQDLVDAAKARAIDLATSAVIAQVAALTGPLSGIVAWFFDVFASRLIRWVVTQAIEYIDRGLFNLNMSVVVSDQGSDYRKAEAALILAKADPNITDEAWERLEDAANIKFADLFNFTR